jgi:hypothetical protein
MHEQGWGFWFPTIPHGSLSVVLFIVPRKIAGLGPLRQENG